MEIARDIGQADKFAGVLRHNAMRCGIPAVTALYRHSGDRLPGNPGCCDIDRFRVRRLAPRFDREFTTLTPEKFAEWIQRHHHRHELVCRELVKAEAASLSEHGG